MTVHIYVELKQNSDGYPPFDAEELDADKQRDGSYLLISTPVFARGLTKGDLVSVASYTSPDDLWITPVITSSTNWNARVVPFGTLRQEVICFELAKLGCDTYPTEFGIVVANMANTVDADAVLALLAAGRETGRWDYDIGVAPPHAAEQ